MTNKKPIIDTQKIERKESKHNIKGSHRTTREDSKGRKKEQRTIKTTKK